MSNLDKLNFPYKELREGQNKFIVNVIQTIKTQKNLLVSAPTGSGKTICAISPTLFLAEKLGKKIVYLTSRQTQINQAIKTLFDISKKSQKQIKYSALISKYNMCVNEEKEITSKSDFLLFCKNQKKDGKCIYYNNFKKKDEIKKIEKLYENTQKNFFSIEDFTKYIGKENFVNYCPYEVSSKNISKSKIIICDYNYFFVPHIRKTFFEKLNCDFEDIILIVDEAHNLPDRIRSSQSKTLTLNMIKNLENVLKDNKLKDYFYTFEILNKIIKKLDYNIEYDLKSHLEKDFLINEISKEKNYENFIEVFFDIQSILDERKINSNISNIGEFFHSWKFFDEYNYLRILQIDKKKISIKINCIDVKNISSKILNSTHSSILMSGTLSPIKMYEDILGLENTNLLELNSPFEKKNQLNIICDDVTTKYTSRGEKMYKLYAEKIEKILKSQPNKNCIIFFPSYDLLKNIVKFINVFKLKRTINTEIRFLDKLKKERIINSFKKQDFKNNSSVLFAVTNGSFSEGLDLPNKFLEMVIIVGLPLPKPDLYIKSLISHYEKEYNKGDLYGYIIPAISKIIQAAGRCIRTLNDKGVVIFMDERYKFLTYKNCFPKHYDFTKEENLIEEIKNFFNS